MNFNAPSKKIPRPGAFILGAFGALRAVGILLEALGACRFVAVNQEVIPKSQKDVDWGIYTSGTPCLQVRLLPSILASTKRSICRTRETGGR